MYADYIREREGKEVLETDKGFAVYSFEGPYCYIQDIYVKPDFRRSRAAWEMGETISSLAKAKGCKYLSGTVYAGTNGATESLVGQLAYGFKLHSAENGKILLYKEL
jgi:ribosomal protein S18 acetylase RimI-like enzyme